jgi:predicted Zn-dependent protease
MTLRPVPSRLRTSRPVLAAGALALALAAPAALAASGGSATALPADVTGAGAPLATGGTAPAPGPDGIIDVESVMRDVECDDAQLLGPAATSAGHLTGDQRIRLDATVLVDVAQGAEIAQIEDPDERAAAEKELFDTIAARLAVGVESYRPLDIDLVYSGYQLLQPLVGGKPRQRTTNAQEIIDLAKAQFGGQRPPGSDVVYVVTDLDIQLPGLGNIVAGLADCIGGVALPDRAFAVGETKPEPRGGGVPSPFVLKDLTAKIAAHELGHLFGGHHHYQECGTAAPTAVQRGELGPCTLMTNAVNFQTIPFSTLNGVVVRGHAERWANRPAGAAAAAAEGAAHEDHAH